MAFGKLRKFWDKVKEVGKKAWGGIRKIGQKLMPVAKLAAPMIANAFAPGSGVAVSAGLGVAENLFNSNYGAAATGAAGLAASRGIKIPAWRPKGS
jgi:hypothetical protein